MSFIRLSNNAKSAVTLKEITDLRKRPVPEGLLRRLTIKEMHLYRAELCGWQVATYPRSTFCGADASEISPLGHCEKHRS